MNSIEQSLLRDCLRTPVTEEDGRISAVLCFGPDFPAFAGHFPDQPVLPAVVQLAAVRLLAAGHLDRDLYPCGVNRAKFKAMITPGEQVRISIKLKETADRVHLAFTITSDRGRAASGELICGCRRC